MADGALGVEDLLAIAHKRSIERRARLALALTDLFRDGKSILTDRERATMTDILRRLVHDVEATVRRKIAEHLAKMTSAPRPLVLDLANDDIEVAWPILVESTVLEDIDLIEIVQQRSLEHKLAVCQRGVLSEDVAEALVRSGEESVIVSLLKNTNARLSKATMEYLIEQSQRVDAFREPLLFRRELTPDLAQRMFAWVSAALRAHLTLRFGLDDQTADDLLEGAITEALQEPMPAGKEVALVEEVAQAGVITPRLVREAVVNGHLALYAQLIEKLTGVRRQLALRLLFEASGEGLGVLCRAIDMPREDFLETFRVARRARPFEPDDLAADCQRLDDFYRHLTTETARATTQHWRRDPNYLVALRQVTGVMGKHG